LFSLFAGARKMPERVRHFLLTEFFEPARVLRRFGNLPALDTAGADFHPTVAASGQLNSDRLQIRVEPTPGFVVSV
jgi:hypothetical protein